MLNCFGLPFTEQTELLKDPPKKRQRRGSDFYERFHGNWIKHKVRDPRSPLAALRNNVHNSDRGKRDFPETILPACRCDPVGLEENW